MSFAVGYRSKATRGYIAESVPGIGMTVTYHRIVSGNESELHDEAHIKASRVTVLHIHERVETRGLRPEAVAEALNLAIADVYDALADYHRNLEEIQAVTPHRQAIAENAETLERPE